jgi:hypothetical protein
MGADDLDLTLLYSPPMTVIAHDQDVRGSSTARPDRPGGIRAEADAPMG